MPQEPSRPARRRVQKPPVDPSSKRRTTESVAPKPVEPQPVDHAIAIAVRIEAEARAIRDQIVSEDLTWSLSEDDVKTLSVFQHGGGAELKIDPKTRNLMFGGKRGMMHFTIPPDKKEEGE